MTAEIPEPIPSARLLPVAEGIDAAVAAVRAGECIVMPTDTVYGIGADAFSSTAVQRLLDAKQRGRDMPPPVLIAEPGMLRALASDVPQAALDLAKEFWPGALTLILKAQRTLHLQTGETDGTVAVRVPDHDLARALLRRTGPLAVSSANVSGFPAATSAQVAKTYLGESVSVYLDAGDSPGGVASTIIDFTADKRGRVVRDGAISFTALAAFAPELVALPDKTTDAAAAPVHGDHDEPSPDASLEPAIRQESVQADESQEE